MSNPKISVIIPSFNRFSYLQNSLTSVFNQTYENFEIIIINDGSSEKEYKSYEFPKSVKIIHIDKKDTPDWGGSRQPLRNIGSSHASGEYLAFLDDDDIWMKNKLELQIKKMLDKWMTDDCGDNIIEENDDFNLYLNIAKNCHNAIPSKVIKHKYFEQFTIHSLPENLDKKYYFRI